MALSETTLQKLKKKQEELEQTATKPAQAEEPEEAPPRHRSMAQCIYADNRKKVRCVPGGARDGAVRDEAPEAVKEAGGAGADHARADQ